MFSSCGNHRIDSSFPIRFSNNVEVLEWCFSVEIYCINNFNNLCYPLSGAYRAREAGKGACNFVNGEIQTWWLVLNLVISI